ncbi:hypothetical protein ACFLUG_00005, partial [Chloroflexota bacterium]
DPKGQVYYFVDSEGNKLSSEDYDCDDYALALQRRAAKDGYLMSVTTITQDNNQLHMINLVTIGNAIYYIEPQTDEAWFYCNLD